VRTGWGSERRVMYIGRAQTLVRPMRVPEMGVIIPTFNRARFLERAVTSVLRQGVTPLEILIVDDRSTDDTRQVVERLQEMCGDIRYLANDRTKGPSGARNKGILNASGRYLAFLDSDDEWLDDHLTEAVDVLASHNEIDVLFGNFRIVEEKSGRFIGNFFDAKEVLPTLHTGELDGHIRMLKDDLFTALIRENFFHLGGAVIRARSLQGLLFDEDIGFAEDRDFALRLFRERGAVFAYRTNPVFVMLRHEGNLTGDTIAAHRALAEAHLLLFRKYLAQYRLSDEQKSLICGLIAERFVDLAYSHRQSREYGRALSCLLGSARYGSIISPLRELVKVACSAVLR